MHNKRSDARRHSRVRTASSDGGTTNPVVHWASLMEYFFLVKRGKNSQLIRIMLQKSILKEFRMQLINFGTKPTTLALDNSSLDVALQVCDYLLKTYEEVEFKNSQLPIDVPH